MATAHETSRELAPAQRRLREHVPEVMDAYAAMGKAALTEGALPARFKELIALAIAATRECDGCIASHARGAARHEATEKEVAEAMGVVILMNGGPGTVWGPRALAAYREFAGQVADGRQ
jgi:AhpD family alkylhydroperoxidase